jgi:hypothetical protein
MQEEIWKDVIGYEDIYKVSNLGMIKSLGRSASFGTGNGKRPEIILKLSLYNNGYYMVSLCENGKRTVLLIHRLVALAFLLNKENKPCVNHKNGIKTDNRVQNLEWVTYSENSLHSFRELNRKTYNLGKFGKYHTSSKNVFQFDLNGKFIKFHESLTDAANENGYKVNNISMCATRKQKTAYGFLWRYEPILIK